MNIYDCIFLDRDGTINFDPGYIKNIDEFSFLEDADISEVVQRSIKNFQNSLSDRLKD